MKMLRLLVLICLWGWGSVRGEEVGQALDVWSGADILVVGTLQRVVEGPTSMSLPPIYHHALYVRVTEVLRGQVEVGEQLELHHSVQQEDVPEFPPLSTSVVLRATQARGGLAVDRLAVADEGVLAAARAGAGLPIGWQLGAEGFVSPWAELGGSWEEPPNAAGVPVCARSGRPAWLCGSGIELAIEKVPPEQEVKWTNPDGDGAYTVTVTNGGDEAVPVPALVRRGDEILWRECLVIVCQGKTYPLPGAVGGGGKVEPVVLQPGQSVQTEVQVLGLQGPRWPRGGSRVEFQFCLGEKSSVVSFYYMSRHHDAIRERVLAGQR